MTAVNCQLNAHSCFYILGKLSELMRPMTQFFTLQLRAKNVLVNELNSFTSSGCVNGTQTYLIVLDRIFGRTPGGCG